MTRHQFLSELEYLLKAIPRRERDNTIDFYNELIRDKMESGMTEEAAVAELGLPQSIAAEILSENRENSNTVKMSSSTKTLMIVLLVIGSPIWGGLLIGLLSIMISLLVVPFSILVSLFAVSIALCVSFVATVVAAIVMIKTNAAMAVFSLGAGLIILGIGLLLLMASVEVTRLLIKLTVAGSKKLKSYFEGRRGRKYA